MKYIEYIGYPANHFSFSWPVWGLVFFWLVLPLIIYLLASLTYIRSTYNKRRNYSGAQSLNEVTVIVLGDLGHSPRMTYHAQSLAQMGYQVNLCGYLESSLPQFLYDNENITIYEIPVIHNALNLPYLLFALYKVLMQLWVLSSMFWTVLGDETKFVFIQNPPSLPILAIIGLLKSIWVPQMQICVDWHNLNWSILNLKYQNDNHPVVKLMKFYEQWFSKKFADINLTVTLELKRYLIDQFDINPSSITTFYDRPNEIFKPLKDQEELRKILEANKDIFNDKLNYDQIKDRIVVTSTSFTPDEDFNVLVECLKMLDIQMNGNDNQRLIMIVTGKGPLEDQFMAQINSHEWRHIVIRKVWLPIAQYPNILKISDLGLSLHYSSSGLDLPMKIVDLFGSGVPVVTLGYPVIAELVKHDQNGVILDSSTETTESAKQMAQIIYELLYDPKHRQRYLKIKEGAMKESERRWSHEWDVKLALKMAMDK